VKFEYPEGATPLDPDASAGLIPHHRGGVSGVADHPADCHQQSPAIGADGTDKGDQRTPAGAGVCV